MRKNLEKMFLTTQCWHISA